MNGLHGRFRAIVGGAAPSSQPPTPMPSVGNAANAYNSVSQALDGVVSEPANVALEDIEALFVEFWQRFVVFALVLLAFMLLAIVVPKVVAALGRAAGCWPWTVTQIRYAIRIGLVTLGVVAAFGSVGVSYDVLFLGIVIAGATTSMSGVVNNAFCGVFLQSNGTIQPGKVLVVRGQRGIIVDTDLRHVRIVLTETQPDGQERPTNRHLYVPNNVLCNEPYEANKLNRKHSSSSSSEEVFSVSLAQQQQQPHQHFSSVGRRKPVHAESQFVM